MSREGQGRKPREYYCPRPPPGQESVPGPIRERIEPEGRQRRRRQQEEDEVTAGFADLVHEGYEVVHLRDSQMLSGLRHQRVSAQDKAGSYDPAPAQCEQREYY